MKAKYDTHHGQNAPATTILDAVGDAFFSIDGGLRLTYANKETYRLLDGDEGDLIGKNLVDLIPEAIGWLFYRHLEVARSKGTPCKQDYFKFAGKRFEVYFYPLPEGLAVFLHDITTKWHTDELYRLALFLLDRLNENVFLVRSDGRLFHVNDEVSRLLGYTRDELIHMKIFDIEPRAPDDDWGEYFNSIKERKQAVFESVLKSKGGALIPVEVCANYIELYGNEYYCVTARDITDRKHIEESLRKLSRVVEEGPGVVVITDVKGDIEYVNPKFSELTGYTFDEVRGKNPNILKSGETPLEEYKLLWDAILSGNEWRGEFHNKKKNGELYWESAIISPFKDKGGLITHFIAIKEDITERKQSELELQTAKSLLEMYNDLLGHDINNMNQVGIGFLELAIDTLGLSEEGKMLLSKPLEALINSSKLIDNVRKLQHVKSGGVRHKVMDVNRVLLDVKKSYTNVKDRRIVINYSPVSGCAVEADELLRDVFSNLVGNSIKHSTGMLEIGMGVSSVSENGKKYCKAYVEDNGPGISDSIKNTLFTRFQRGDTKASGKGLGLYLVKTLIDDYGGKVWVEDRVTGEQSKGCRFVIMLPAAIA